MNFLMLGSTISNPWFYIVVGILSIIEGGFHLVKMLITGNRAKAKLKIAIPVVLGGVFILIGVIGMVTG